MKVLLADVHGQIRWALRTFLQEDFGLAVVGEATEAEELLAEAGTLRPDLIFLEWELPGQAPAEILAALRDLELHAKIIVMGHQCECQQEALDAGADAFLCKTALPEQVRLALQPVISGQGWERAWQATPEQAWSTRGKGVVLEESLQRYQKSPSACMIENQPNGRRNPHV